MPVLKKFEIMRNNDRYYWSVHSHKDKFEVSKMLPDLSEYMTYNGSLTTPPLTEVTYLYNNTEIMLTSVCQMDCGERTIIHYFRRIGKIPPAGEILWAELYRQYSTFSTS